MTRPDPYGNGIIQGLTEIVTASNLIGTSFWEVLYKKFTGEIRLSDLVHWIPDVFAFAVRAATGAGETLSVFKNETAVHAL
jgi:hypothetical protein